MCDNKAGGCRFLSAQNALPTAGGRYNGGLFLQVDLTSYTVFAPERVQQRSQDVLLAV